jgi:ankyrin repeat protein
MDMTDEQQMIEAIKAGDADKVRDLIETDIFLADAKNEEGISALLVAIYHGEDEIAEIILDSGPTLSVHEAAAAGVKERVQELIGGDHDLVSGYSADGWTPLHLAVFFNRNDIAELLIAEGADIDAVSKNGMAVTPLHSALANRNGRIAMILIGKGADVNARSGAGYMPLHYTAANNMETIAEVLLERGVDTAAREAEGRTPYELARQKGHEDLAGLIERYGK